MGIFKASQPEKKIDLDDMTGRGSPDNTIVFDNGTSEGEDSISLMAAQELMKNKKTTSRVKMEQVQVLTRLYLYSLTFKIPFTKTLADGIMQIQVSINGLGRKELVQLVQRRMDTFDPAVRVPTSKDIFR